MMYLRAATYILTLICSIGAINATAPQPHNLVDVWHHQTAAQKSSSLLPLVAAGFSIVSIYAARQLYKAWHAKIKQTAFKITYKAEIVPGVLYTQMTQESTPLIVHELVIDPQRVSITAYAACDTCGSAEKPSEAASRNNAIAAINCSFFDFGVSPLQDLCIKILDLIGLARYNAFPMYALKMNGKWLSLSAITTGIFAWNDGGKVTVASIAQTKCTLTVCNHHQCAVADFNKPNMQTPVIYTDNYGAKTPLGKDICSLVIQDNHITAISMGGGIEIPQGAYVYAQHGEATTVSVGDTVNLTLEHETANQALHTALEAMPYVVGSTPLLLENGAVTPAVEYGTSTFFTKLHPRTAIGILPDGNWIFIVVDGRQSCSAGISLKDLALYMQSRGCISALNLDGGGSSTMVIDNEVVNNPSGREYSLVAGERPGASSLLVMPRS